MADLPTFQEGVASIFGSLTKDPSALGQYMGNYRFPSDLTTGAGRNFYVDIQFQKYQRRSIFQQPFLQATGGIQLPIPNNLVETTMAEWSQQEGGLTGAAIENLLGKTNNNIGSLFSGSSWDIGQRLNAALDTGAVRLGLNALTGALGGGSVNQALQLAGRSQNPFLTMLFKQPSFKQHSFTWRLAPRNERESETVRQIILAFKANMLPAIAPGSGGIFLTYPNMAMISFYPAQDFLYKFKPCVVRNFKVNYADGGMPSFFRRTNAPTLVSITVDLIEIEYWLREDIVDPAMRSEGMTPTNPAPTTPVTTQSNPTTSFNPRGGRA